MEGNVVVISSNIEYNALRCALAILLSLPTMWAPLICCALTHSWVRFKAFNRFLRPLLDAVSREPIDDVDEELFRLRMSVSLSRQEK